MLARTPTIITFNKKKNQLYSSLLRQPIIIQMWLNLWTLSISNKIFTRRPLTNSLNALTNFVTSKRANCVKNKYNRNVWAMEQESEARQILSFSLRINSHINVNLIIAVYEHKHPFVALVLCTMLLNYAFHCLRNFISLLLLPLLFGKI